VIIAWLIFKTAVSGSHAKLNTGRTFISIKM